MNKSLIVDIRLPLGQLYQPPTHLLFPLACLHQPIPSLSQSDRKIKHKSNHAVPCLNSPIASSADKQGSAKLFLSMARE